MKSVFLDTSGLIALTDSDDYWHSQAVEIWRGLLRRNQPLTTTSLILIELADGLAKIHFRSIAIKLRQAFTQRSDKSWVMTDCVSFATMAEQGISDVFGLDHHFEQTGFNLLIK